MLTYVSRDLCAVVKFEKNPMVAVITTGGKQYLVAEGDVIAVEKMDGAPDATVTFNDVLMVATEGDDAAVTLGTPTVGGARVEGKIVDQTRAKKVWGVKYKPKKRYRVVFGHKQPQTLVEITKITTK